MIFKFLNRPITITAFASELYQAQCEQHSIEPSSKFIPNWWKKTPKSEFDFTEFQRKTTVKSCLGIIGTFQNGYIIPLWSDLAIQIREDRWRYEFSDRTSVMDVHPSRQAPNFYENFMHAKISSPWLLKSSTDIKYCFVHPFYGFPNPLPYVTPYGIISSLKKRAPTNIFLFFEKKPTDIILKSGTPLLQIIPLTEKPIIFKREIVSVDEWNKMNNISSRTSFVGTGLKLLKKYGEK
jgi:hypothetical protein